jgi:hypothetical protein
MSDAPEEEGAEGDVDQAPFVVSHEASPAHHPSEGLRRPRAARLSREERPAVTPPAQP